MPATAAQIAANQANAAHSTGPRTPEGKARSSRNALKLGLFTATDLIRPEEQHTYDQRARAFWQELAPETALEQTHVLEIIRASWRLERCSQIEAGMLDRMLETGLDPMEDPAAVRTQNAVDRARATANNTIRRATAELRRLQTERMSRTELDIPADAAIGLADQQQVLRAIYSDHQCRLARHRSSIVDLERQLDITPAHPASEFYRPPAAKAHLEPAA